MQCPQKIIHTALIHNSKPRFLHLLHQNGSSIEAVLGLQGFFALIGQTVSTRCLLTKKKKCSCAEHADQYIAISQPLLNQHLKVV